MSDLVLAFDIWKRLKPHFNMASLAHVLDLKFMLTNLSKEDNQSMEDYLQIVKATAGSLVVIQSPVSDLQLIQYITVGLEHYSDYEGFVTPYSMLPGAHSFDNLHSNLTFF